jgi:hypothetical protein
VEAKMEIFDLVVDRKHSCSGSIIGELSVNGSFLCYTLELPWRWNQNNVSCIPLGRYRGYLRYDKADGWRIQLTNVPGRAGVQIHVGNYPSDIKGCILVGTTYTPNKVLNSGKAYALLKEAFYGSKTPNYTPNKAIFVEFTGILSTPWGDYSYSMPSLA